MSFPEMATPAGSPTTASRRPAFQAVWPVVKIVALHALGWAILGTMFALQVWVNSNVDGRPVPLSMALSREVVRWVLWAVPSPFIALITMRLLAMQSPIRTVLVLLAIAPIAMTVRTVGAVYINSKLFATRPGGPGMMEVITRSLQGRFALDTFIYVAIVAASAAWYAHRQSRARAMQATKLESQLARARLEALEAHLHPHFLFNMLHTVSALLDHDPKEARRMLVRFGDLLRMSLEARTTPYVTLAWEEAFVTRYLEIQRMRFPDRLEASVDIPVDLRQIEVPRLLLQPLVENAVRHGVEPSPTLVAVRVDATRTNDTLTITVTNAAVRNADRSAAPAAPNATTASGKYQRMRLEQLRTSRGSGVGLTTTEARLQQAYGNAASLTLHHGENGSTTVTVKLPVQNPAAEDSN